MGTKAAIYHFTNESKKRPIVYKKQLQELKDYAISMGFEVSDIFCDMSKKQSERTEYSRFLANCENYDILIAKDFYHISKTTGTFMSNFHELKEKGLEIHTLENGVFICDEPPFNDTRRVVTYTRHFGTPNELREFIPVKNDVLKLFTEKKTDWILLDQYFDESIHQRNEEQIQLKELIRNHDKYDLLLVHKFNDINLRTSHFCKVREQLHMDIYSLQEGFLKYY